MLLYVYHVLKYGTSSRFSVHWFVFRVFMLMQFVDLSETFGFSCVFLKQRTLRYIGDLCTLLLKRKSHDNTFEFLGGPPIYGMFKKNPGGFKRSDGWGVPHSPHLSELACGVCSVVQI